MCIRDRSNIDEILKVHGKNILVVKSSAIHRDNFELCKAKKYNLKNQASF